MAADVVDFLLCLGDVGDKTGARLAGQVSLCVAEQGRDGLVAVADRSVNIENQQRLDRLAQGLAEQMALGFRPLVFGDVARGDHRPDDPPLAIANRREIVAADPTVSGVAAAQHEFGIGPRLPPQRP
jgi:hypothetical protein